MGTTLIKDLDKLDNYLDNLFDAYMNLFTGIADTTFDAIHGDIITWLFGSTYLYVWILIYRLTLFFEFFLDVTEFAKEPLFYPTKTAYIDLTILFNLIFIIIPTSVLYQVFYQTPLWIVGLSS